MSAHADSQDSQIESSSYAFCVVLVLGTEFPEFQASPESPSVGVCIGLVLGGAGFSEF